MIDDPKLFADCLLAVVGLLPEKITARERQAAELLPAKFADHARAWWKKDRKPYKEIKPPRDLDALLDAVSVKPTSAQLAAWLKRAGDDTEAIEAMHVGLGKARAYLVQQWPRIPFQTFAGTQMLPLSIDDTAEVISLWAVMNSPERILDEMDAYTLTDTQALAFRTVFPALFAHYTAELRIGSAKMLVADPEWSPDESQDIVCGVLTGKPPGVIPADAAAAPGAQTTPAKDLGASAARTQADASSQPKSAQK